MSNTEIRQTAPRPLRLIRDSNERALAFDCSEEKPSLVLSPRPGRESTPSPPAPATRPGRPAPLLVTGSFGQRLSSLGTTYQSQKSSLRRLPPHFAGSFARMELDGFPPSRPQPTTTGPSASSPAREAENPLRPRVRTSVDRPHPYSMPPARPATLPRRPLYSDLAAVVHRASEAYASSICSSILNDAVRNANILSSLCAAHQEDELGKELAWMMQKEQGRKLREGREVRVEMEKRLRGLQAGKESLKGFLAWTVGKVAWTVGKGIRIGIMYRGKLY